MLGRTLGWIAVAVSSLAGTVLGVTGVALRTPVGRRIVVERSVRAVNQELHGALTVGGVGGSFFRGLEVQDVAVRGADGTAILTADLVGIRYRIADLLRGRIVFGELRLSGPKVTLVQAAPGEPFNFERLFPPGERTGGPGPLIAFNDVQISGGEFVIKTPVGPRDTVHERESGSNGDLQVRRFASLYGTLSYLRVASNRPGDPILAEINHLRTEASDPRISVLNARGSVELFGDSVRLNLAEVRLPRTRGELSGRLSWDQGPLLVAFRGEATPGRTDDVRGLVATLPAGIAGNGRFTVNSMDDAVLEFSGEELVMTADDGGRMRGRLGMRIGPGEQWAFQGTSLDLDAFDLDYVRGFLDTVPFAGTLTGSLAADGPADSLRLSLDATFTDRLVGDEPQSYVRGEGVVAVLSDDFVFDRFRVEEADIGLGTVRRLVPAMVVQGRLYARGLLDGSWLNATLAGELRHRDAPLPETVARGRVRLDARRDTLGVWVDVTLDSLQLEGLRSSFDGWALQGAWAGPLSLAGYWDSLVIQADLEGPAGSVRAAGSLELLDSITGAHDLHLQTRSLDLAAVQSGLPRTRLSGDARGAGSAGADGASRFRASVALGRSSIKGVTVDSVEAHASLADGFLGFDTLQVLAAGLDVQAAGRIGLGAAQQDTVTFTATTDTIGVLEPIIQSWLGPLETDEVAARPSGTLRAAGRVIGSVDEYQVIADLEMSQVRRGPLFVSRAGGAATWVSTTRSLRFDGVVDSTVVGAVALGGLRVQLHGRPDSLNWHGRSRLGYGAWMGRGQWIANHDVSRVVLDSLGLSLASGPWFIDTAASIILDDSGLTFSDLTFASLRGSGRLAVRGRWPFRGPGTLDGSVSGLPVSDVLVLLLRDPEEASGELSGTLAVGGTARAPEFRFLVSLRDGVYGEFRAPPDTRGVVEYRDRVLAADLELWRLGKQVLKVTAGFPLDLALTGAVRRRLPGPIQVRAMAEGVDLSLFEATAPFVRDIAGTLDADFGIEGTWERPELAGHLAVRGGAATFPALGVRHEALNGSLALSGDTIRVETLSLRSGDGGAEIRGVVRLEELSRPLLDLQVQARRFRSIDVRGFLSLTATADLQLRGPVYQATLTGRGTATSGVLYFTDLITKNVVNLEDTLFAEFVDTTLLRRQGLGAEFESRFLDSLRIDSLRLGMGSDFWMRSSEANVQLAGDVTVSKLRGRYRLDGTLQAPRGTYRLQLGLGTSREFAVTRGEIRYLGTPDLNADLDIDAQHAVRSTLGEDVRVFVNIGGSLYDPRLSLSSDVRPPLSEPEIINYLVFGAPTLQAGGGTSGLESRLLTQAALGTLSGQIEYALISDLGAPIDYFQIRPTTGVGGVTGAVFAVGKQFSVLGTTAFLTASPRVCRQEALSFQSGGASLEFRLSRQWLVAASVDPLRSCEISTAPSAGNYQFGADLFWERSF
jgi:autotransporter translocation and assembly factor TamB